MNVMASFWIGIVILALVENAASLHDPEVCDILEESCGLIPPPLPRNFELKGERVDHLAKFAGYEEMYFDYTNSRAKYKFLFDTVEYNYLFDYDSQQIVQWVKIHPGTSMKKDPLSYKCEAVNMDESDLTNIFGDEDTINLRPKMFNSNKVLRYGGQYLYAADGSTKLSDRNMETNKFVGCVYDDSIDATLKNDYYFANTSIVQPSGGTPSSVVTGFEGWPLSVPVKMHLTGRRYEQSKAIPIDKTISISWFRGEPQFEMGTFQIPPWIHCDNYHKLKEVPKFPTAFSTRVAITNFSVDILGQLQMGESFESFDEIYYDSDRKLARRDFTPNPNVDTDIYGKFGSYSPVSTIYDFNEGLRYTINKPTGRCYIRPIGDNEFFDTEEDLLYNKLATPEEIFLMQMDDMEYKGKALARDIMCDVWNGQHTHTLYNITFVKETYFSTDGWHEIADEMLEYRVPVRHVIIRKKLDDELSRHIISRDFLKFKAKAPKMNSFSIENCVDLINHERLAIELTLDEDSAKIFQYKFPFLEAAQLYITNKTELNTPLRVQRLHLRHLSPSSPRLFLLFSLLDKANLNNLPVVVGQKGKDLQEAMQLLLKLVDSGNFSVQFKNPKNEKEMITALAERGSLYSLTASGSLTRTPFMLAKFGDLEVNGITNEEETIHDESSGMELKESAGEEEEITTEEHNGMKNSGLALLSCAMLFIGIVIGIAIMYFYIRVYSERYIDDKIKLTLQEGPSTSGEASGEGPV